MISEFLSSSHRRHPRPHHCPVALSPHLRPHRSSLRLPVSVAQKPRPPIRRSDMQEKGTTNHDATLRSQTPSKSPLPESHRVLHAPVRGTKSLASAENRGLHFPSLPPGRQLSRGGTSSNAPLAGLQTKSPLSTSNADAGMSPGSADGATRNEARPALGEHMVTSLDTCCDGAEGVAGQEGETRVRGSRLRVLYDLCAPTRSAPFHILVRYSTRPSSFSP